MTTVVEAARNNAEWCNSFCRSCGVEAAFTNDVWATVERPPPFYPDVVTLRAGVEPLEVVAHAQPGAGYSVKDSFADLELSALGFDVLFMADWLAGANVASEETRGWSPVTDESGLREWSTAWGDGEAFHSALPGDPAVSVLACRVGGSVVAGAVANRSETVIGISNLFGADAWSGTAGCARRVFGDLPIVGYTTTDGLEAARRVGLEPIGGLRVWKQRPIER